MIRTLETAGTIRNHPARTVPISWPDYLAHLALHRRELHVDAGQGTIHRPDGTRAEHLEKRSGYGRVIVATDPKLVLAMAHRVVWIAAQGLIPAGLVVSHRNGHRWDNRLNNLQLTTTAGSNRRVHGLRHEAADHDTWHDVLAALSAGPDARPDGNRSNPALHWPPHITATHGPRRGSRRSAPPPATG